MLAAASILLPLDQAKAQTLYGSAGAQDTRENATNMDWAYNWSNTPKYDVAKGNFEFVPMIWTGGAAGVINQVNTIKALEQTHGVHVDYVLGFNEPELPTQADMTVEQAINSWDVITDGFADTDIKLVSPAVSGNREITRPDVPGSREDGWLVRFMDEVESRNSDSNPSNDLQIDVIAYHFYTVGFNPQTEANKLLDQLDYLWETYQRPIWLTEFAGTSFSLNNPVHSAAERSAFNRDFLEILIPEFDARPYVERVAYWQFGALGIHEYSRLIEAPNGPLTPTIIGDVYSRTTLMAGDSYDLALGERRSTDVHYLKGGNLMNTGLSLGPALRAVDAIEGNSSIGGTDDFEFEEAEDAFLRVRAGATLRKTGGNTLTLFEGPIDNDGTLLIQGGSLELAGTSELIGTGTIRVDQNGTLATAGKMTDDQIRLDSQLVILNQGLLHVMDGQAVASQQLRFWNPSEVRTDGDLIVSGFTAGAGRILSTGEGTLFLTGEGLHADGATVSEGSLIVSNTDASATGAGTVIANGTGTFGGTGLVDGDVLVEAGGTVAPAISMDEGVVTAIDFDFNGVQTNAPLTQTSTISSAIRLVSGLNLGSGVVASNAGNEGNEFNVSGFRTDTNYSVAGRSGDYLTFTIAPVDGLAMIIKDVTFEFRRHTTGAARQYTIGSSIDGFAWPERWGNVIVDSGDRSRQPVTGVNTSSEALTDEVEIRISGVNTSNQTGNTHFYSASVNASFVSDFSGVPLNPVGILQLGGNYTQLDFATLKIDLGGAVAGEFDQLQVAGNASLNGTLDVSMLDGFTATAGQTFDIITANSITGTFDDVIAPEGMDVQVTYSSNAVSLQVTAGLTGDFDADGDVDVDDIDFYAGNMNSPATGALAQLDFNGDGQITRQDLVFHIENFVQTSNGQTGALLGDLNLDGTVDILSDAFTMIGNLNQAVSSYADGDMDMNGTVNVLGDAFVLIGNLGSSNALSAAN